MLRSNGWKRRYSPGKSTRTHPEERHSAGHRTLTCLMSGQKAGGLWSLLLAPAISRTLAIRLCSSFFFFFFLSFLPLLWSLESMYLAISSPKMRELRAEMLFVLPRTCAISNSTSGELYRAWSRTSSTYRVQWRLSGRGSSELTFLGIESDTRHAPIHAPFSHCKVKTMRTNLLPCNSSIAFEISSSLKTAILFDQIMLEDTELLFPFIYTQEWDISVDSRLGMMRDLGDNWYEWFNLCQKQ